MNMEAGKFYMHEKGRKIAVIGQVESFKWGPMLVVEETDDTGHSISCVETKDSDLNDNNWVEIGRDEWMRNFA
jgi:hypothetical protein